MIGYVPVERRRKSKSSRGERWKKERARACERGSERVWMKGSNDFASISFADPIPLSLYYGVIPAPK